MNDWNCLANLFVESSCQCICWIVLRTCLLNRLANVFVVLFCKSISWIVCKCICWTVLQMYLLHHFDVLIRLLKNNVEMKHKWIECAYWVRLKQVHGESPKIDLSTDQNIPQQQLIMCTFIICCPPPLPSPIRVEQLLQLFKISLSGRHREGAQCFSTMSVKIGHCQCLLGGGDEGFHPNYGFLLFSKGNFRIWKLYIWYICYVLNTE